MSIFVTVVLTTVGLLFVGMWWIVYVLDRP